MPARPLGTCRQGLVSGQVARGACAGDGSGLARDTAGWSTREGQGFGIQLHHNRWQSRAPNPGSGDGDPVWRPMTWTPFEAAERSLTLPSVRTYVREVVILGLKDRNTPPMSRMWCGERDRVV